MQQIAGVAGLILVIAFAMYKGMKMTNPKSDCPAPKPK